MPITKKSSPLVSIVVPAYNEQDYIARCLGSLMAQKGFKDYEVIVVDNNSTDNTNIIAKKYPVRVIKENKQGVVSARNTGLKSARGSIIVSTDADCFFKPYWLSNIVEIYENNPKISGVAGHYNFYKAPLWAKILPPMGAVIVWMVSGLFRKTIYASATNISFKKEYFSRGYDTVYFQGADERGVIKEISKHGSVFVTLKNPVCTSSRRVKQGFLHSIFVTVLYYYSYNVWSTGKKGASSIGGHPTIRTETALDHLDKLVVQWLIMLAIGIIVIFIIWK